MSYKKIFIFSILTVVAASATWMINDRFRAEPSGRLVSAGPPTTINLDGVYLAQAESTNPFVPAAQAAGPTKLTRYLPTDSDVTVPVKLTIPNHVGNATITLHIKSSVELNLKKTSWTPSAAPLTNQHAVPIKDGQDFSWQLDTDKLDRPTQLTITPIFHTPPKTNWFTNSTKATVDITADVRLSDDSYKNSIISPDQLSLRVLLLGKIETKLIGVEHRKTGSSEYESNIVVKDLDKIPVYPGDRLTYALEWTNDLPFTFDRPDDFQLQLDYRLGVEHSYVSFVTAADQGHLKKDAQGHETQTIVWRLSDLNGDQSIAPRQVLKTSFQLHLDEKIPFDEADVQLSQLSLTPTVQETYETQGTQPGTAVLTDLWGEVTGRFTVTDDEARDPQPVPGVKVELKKQNDKVINAYPVVTGFQKPHEESSKSKLGIYELPFKRVDLGTNDKQTDRSVFIQVSYDNSDIDDIPYPMKFVGPTEPGSENEIQLYFSTSRFQVLPNRLMQHDIHLSAVSRDDGDDIGVTGGSLDRIRGAAAIWKNYWSALALTDTKLDINIPEKFQHLLKVNFISSMNGTRARARDYDVVLSRSVWEPWGDRRFATVELHELGHNFVKAIGDFDYNRAKFSALKLTSLGLAKIPNDSINSDHNEVRNDTSANSLDEGVASLMSVWWDQLINNPSQGNCLWCYYYTTGGNVIEDLSKPMPAMAVFMPTNIFLSFKANKTDAGNSEEFSISRFIEYYLTGGINSSEDYGWTSQTVSLLNLTLKNNNSIDLSIPAAADNDEIWRRLKIIVGALETQSIKNSGHHEEMFADFYNQLVADNVADPALKDAPERAAILMGMFRDGNADWAYDPEEHLGQIAHDQPVWSGKTLFGGRPWRDDPNIRPDLDGGGNPLAALFHPSSALAANDEPPAQSVPLPTGAAINLVIKDASGQPVANGVPISVKIDFAPPYQRFDYGNTFTSRGGLISLLLPDPIYITRAIISVGSPAMPVLIVDSDDFWQIISQDSPPPYVAQKTVTLANLQPIAVPDWPKDVLVPASHNSIEFMNLAAAKIDSGQPTTITTAPVTLPDHPAASFAATQSALTPSAATAPLLTSPRIISSHQASAAPGQMLAISLTGFAAPATVTATLDKGTKQEQKSIATPRIITPDAQVTVTIPDQTPAGPHTLMITGGQGESVTLKLDVAGVTPTARRLLPSLLLALALAFVFLAAVFLKHRQYSRSLNVILLAVVLMAGSRVLAESAQPTADRFAGRRADFAQLVPNYQNQFLVLPNFQGKFQSKPEIYFGSPETISFIQQAAWRWWSDISGSSNKDERMVVERMSDHDLSKSSKEFGVQFHIENQQGNPLYVVNPDSGQWNEAGAKQLARSLVTTWHLLNPGQTGSKKPFQILIQPPKGTRLDADHGWPKEVRASTTDEVKGNWWIRLSRGMHLNVPRYGQSDRNCGETAVIMVVDYFYRQNNLTPLVQNGRCSEANKRYLDQDLQDYLTQKKLGIRYGYLASQENAALDRNTYISAITDSLDNDGPVVQGVDVFHAGGQEIPTEQHYWVISGYDQSDAGRLMFDVIDPTDPDHHYQFDEDYIWQHSVNPTVGRYIIFRKSS